MTDPVYIYVYNMYIGIDMASKKTPDEIYTCLSSYLRFTLASISKNNLKVYLI